MSVTLYTHPSSLDHLVPAGHLERAARIETLNALFAEESFSKLPRGTVKPATHDQLLRAHDRRYIETLEERDMDQYPLAVLDGGDTYMSPGTWNAALHAAGAVCAAVDDVITGKARRAFCALRPPGHHAEPHKSMGFCLLNNVFIGAMQARAVHGIEKIAIVDFDVHHGNGTDAMTRRQDGIFYTSTHEWPLFPGTGTPDSSVPGKILNAILAPGQGSQELRDVYNAQVFPALRDFKPDLLMISAGFDGCKDDPYATQNASPDDYYWLTENLCAIANEYCNGKVISTLEGGYGLENLKACTSAHLRGLMLS